MIIELFGKDKIAASPVFADMDDTTILSCLQDYPNSHVWVDSLETPSCAHVLMGGKGEGTAGFSFVAGDADSPAARELIAAWREENRGGCTIVPQNEKWEDLIKERFTSGEFHIRYAISKTEHHFDVERLRKMAANPAEDLQIVRIDASMYDTIYSQKWSCDLVANFNDGETFERLAAGFACVHHGEIVGAASCYSVYDKGIEIEIDTRVDYRRKGIARACAASLVLYALEKGLYPSWDAANLMSVGLAESLGYVYTHEYPAYWISAECRQKHS